MQFSKMLSVFLFVLGVAALAVPNPVTPSPTDVATLSSTTSSFGSAFTSSTSAISVSSAPVTNGDATKLHARISNFQPVCFDGTNFNDCQYQYLPFYCDNQGVLQTAAPAGSPCGAGGHCFCEWDGHNHEQAKSE